MKRNSKTIKGYFAGLLTALLIAGLALSANAASLLKEIQVSIGGIQIYVDGALKQPADANGNTVEPMIYNGTTYLPVRALTGMLTDKAVDWDGSTQTVYIGKKPDNSGYRSVVQELVNKYGVADAAKLQKLTEGNIEKATLSGVYGVKQLDLDGNGTDELFVLWKPGAEERAENALSAAIYTMEGDTAVRKWYQKEAVYESGVCGVNIHMLGSTPVIFFSSTRYFSSPLICYHEGSYKNLAAISYTPAEEAKIAEGQKSGLSGESSAMTEIMLARVGLTAPDGYNPVFKLGGEGVLGLKEADAKNLKEALTALGVSGF